MSPFLPKLRMTLTVLLFAVTAQVSAQSAGKPVELVLNHRVDFQTENGIKSFCAHFADDLASRQFGLMFQTDLPGQAGMLFDFQQSRTITMWMENTILSLDMIFITQDLKVLRIADHTTPYSREIISSQGNARYVLEINAGRASQEGIDTGDLVSFTENGC